MNPVEWSLEGIRDTLAAVIDDLADVQLFCGPFIVDFLDQDPKRLVRFLVALRRQIVTEPNTPLEFSLDLKSGQLQLGIHLQPGALSSSYWAPVEIVSCTSPVRPPALSLRRREDGLPFRLISLV